MAGFGGVVSFAILYVSMVWRRDVIGASKLACLDLSWSAAGRIGRGGGCGSLKVLDLTAPSPEDLY